MARKDQTSTEFQFQRPTFEDTTQAADIALGLAAISSRLAQEKRTRLEHPDGRSENVAEHTLTLAKTAPELAIYMYPGLDPNLVARFATVHDDVEAYVGDTPTDIITDESLALKQQREQRGIARLIDEYSEVKSYVALITDYEAQKIPEARFVRVVDKLMPILSHFSNSGVLLKRLYDNETYLDPKRRSPTSARLLVEYPEFKEVIELREELVNLMARMHL